MAAGSLNFSVCYSIFFELKAASAVIELRDFDASKQQSAKPFFSSDMSPSQPSF